MTDAIVVESGKRRGARFGRREVLRWGFWSGLGALAVASGAGLLNTLWPRRVMGFGAPIFVPANAIPQPGESPRLHPVGRFHLVHLAPDEGRHASDDEDSPGGLLALYRKCPHLGCTVPWKETWVAPDDALGRVGFFNCNCHSSTYTRAGVLVRGPAKRSMDTMRIDVTDGGIVVDTGDIREGGEDNPRRAVAFGVG